MKSEPATFDARALSELLVRDDVTPSVLEELFGSSEVGDELLRGERLPSRREASLLGALLGVDPSVLTGAKRPSLGVSLRLGTAQVEHDVVEPVEHAMKLLTADRLTEQWGFRTPAADLSAFPVSRRQFKPKEDGKTTAVRLRARLELDPLSPIEDLTSLVESMGCVVEYRPLPNNVHGISVPEIRGSRKVWAILVNSHDYWALQRFTLAHELSHVLYQDSGQIIVDRAQTSNAIPEIIADSFSRHFLFPDDALEELLEKHGRPGNLADTDRLVVDIMLTYGISRQATLKALRDSKDPLAPPESLLHRCEGVAVRSMMASVGAGAAWSEMAEAEGCRYASPRLTEHVLAAFADNVVSLPMVADVIADGDEVEAARQLTAAGWDLPAAAER
ncbi:ImmA/IrrE family metallo-endopeptidase [Streptomyces sp. NBC_00328]|uniref:ImmA/IrrE family metallo-endopeptidase n=1 Tax=Streptomyces sp. NBC_00328 TaxID=2903646 RepID=UPI002E2C822C|nr:ImmA/IrrE family metallo-endopeptidase [Streptomyces sp. NBC_00328]